MISGSIYKSVCRNLAKQYNHPLPSVFKRYIPRNFRFNEATKTGEAKIHRPTIALPSKIQFDHLGNLLGEKAKPVQMLIDWPQHWKARIVAVRKCFNLDSLQSLLKTETSAAVQKAIREQLKLNGVEA